MFVGQRVPASKRWRLYLAWPTRDERTFLAWVPERNRPEFRQRFARFLMGDGNKRLGARCLPPFHALIDGMTVQERSDLLAELEKQHIVKQVDLLNKKLSELPARSTPRRLLQKLNYVPVSTPDRETAVRRLGYSIRDAPTKVSLGQVETAYERMHKPPHEALEKKMKSIEAGNEVHLKFLSLFPRLSSQHGSLKEIGLMLRMCGGSLTKEESSRIEQLRAAKKYKEVKELRDRQFDRSLMGLLILCRNRDQKVFYDFMRALLAEQTQRRIQGVQFIPGTELSEACLERGLRAGLSREELVFLADKLRVATMTQDGSATLMSQVCCLYAREPDGLLKWLDALLLQQHELRYNASHQAFKQMVLAWPAVARHLSQSNGGPSLDEILGIVSDLGPSQISIPAQTRKLQREGLKLRQRSRKG